MQRMYADFPPAFLQLLALVLVLSPVAGFVAVVAAGIRRRRPVLVVGPVLLAVMIAANWVTAQRSAMEHLASRVTALDQRAVKPPSRHHDLVVLEFNRATACDALCQGILVHSTLSVGVAGNGASTIVYRRISEAECRATWYTAHNQRFAGICARVETLPSVQDALLIETPATYVAGGDGGPDAFPGLPPQEFSGLAFALVERSPGAAERVLGRWIAGRVSVWPFDSGPIGADFSREDFYTAALGVDFQ
jgi:hypothetical protein